MIRSATDFIDVCVTVRIPRDFVQAWLVMTVTSGEKTLWWNSVPITEYVLPGRTGTVRGSLRVADVDLRHHGIQFMTFIWNPKKLPLALDDFTVSVRTGNPLIYGLYRRVPRYQ
jgi:hypothetical protein